MIYVLGVNELSLEVFNKIQEEKKIIGPYREKISDNHLNETLSSPVTISNFLKEAPDLVINMCFNTITSLIINDVCLYSNIRLVSVVCTEDTILIKKNSQYSCLRCFIDTPTMSNILIAKQTLARSGLNQSEITKAIFELSEDNVIFTAKGEKITNPNVTRCPSCSKGKFKYLGDFGEIVNPNCSDNSTIIYPVDDRSLDMSKLHKVYLQEDINVTSFDQEYIVIEVEEKKLFIWKTGRVIISGVKEKEFAEYIYRRLIGN